MSDTDGNVVEDGNLDDFAAEFFGSAKQEDTVEEVVEEVAEEVGPAEEVEETETEAEEQEDDPEADEEEDEESEPEPEPKKRKTAKDRIQELANERREERDARIAAETRLRDLEAKLAELDGKKEAAAPQNAAKESAPDPDATDDAGELVYPLGEFDPKYIADLTKFHFRQEAEAAKAEAAEEAKVQKAREAEEAMVSSWEAKLDETAETLPDLRDKLITLDETFHDLEPEYGNYLAKAIMQMDRGPEVLYYLANNIGEAQKIVASGPVAAIIALGRLEGIMTAPAEKRNEKKKVSKAPEPPLSTRGVGHGRSVNGDTDDLEAFEREFFHKK